MLSEREETPAVRLWQEGIPGNKNLYGSGTWRIYRSGHWFWRYDVARPDGSIYHVFMTLWGAKRAIRKAVVPPKPLRPQQGRKWWEQPYLDMGDGRDA